jgi:B12-binding domain/radical SAM domain protein
MSLTVVWAYRRTGKFAFHVLSGALGQDPRTRGVRIEFAPGPDAVAAAAAAASARGDAVLVGWSFYSPDAERMFAELADVRARLAAGGATEPANCVRRPRLVHVAGGVHATAEPAASLRAGFDLVALGEGEATVCDLAATLAAGGEPRAVPGLAWLAPDGVLRRSAGRPRLDLDQFPPFALELDRLGPIEITRGCVYACRFCQTPFFAGAAFRHRSLRSIRHWVRALVVRGFRDFRFLTPTALSYGARGPEPDLDAVEDLLAGVRADIGPARRLYFGTFPSEVRPEHVTARALRLLGRYVDNRTLILGGQSGSEAVLQRARRGHTAAAVERAAALCVEHGFVPHVDYLFGLPGEDAEAVAATLAQMQALVALGARVHGHTFMPLPGTPLRRAAPGMLAPDLDRRLQVLSSRGAAYGQWRQQVAIAQRLAAARGAAGPGPAADGGRARQPPPA